MIKKQVILIPYWVQETLKRNPSVTLADCVDFVKMRPLLSANDLIGFLAAQRCFKHILGRDEVLYQELYWLWSKSIPSDQKELYQFLTGTLDALSSDESYHKELHERLFSAQAKISQYEQPFNCYDLNPEALGVVIYPGFFVGTNTQELQISVIKAILKVLYVYDTYSEVAKTSLFKRYLELLRTQ